MTATPDTTARRELAEAERRFNPFQAAWDLLVSDAGWSGFRACEPYQTGEKFSLCVEGPDGYSYRLEDETADACRMRAVGYCLGKDVELPKQPSVVERIAALTAELADLRARNERLERELLDLRESQRPGPDGGHVPGMPRVNERHGCSRCTQRDAEAARYDQDVARMVTATGQEGGEVG